MTSKTDPQRVIVIVCDSLRQDHVSYFDRSTVKTPHIDSLFADGVAFHNGYPEALPTIPVRTSLFTGRRTLPYHGWEPLDSNYHTIQEILGSYGFRTALVTDNPHFMEAGMNLHQEFDFWRWIRGQAGDHYRSSPADVELSDYVKKAMEGTFPAQELRQYFKNVQSRDDADESEFSTSRSVDIAIQWLDRNRDADRQFLWLDIFDPHEPWDPPESYRGNHTDPAYDGADLIYPAYGSIGWLERDEIEHIRGRYREEVQFVDDQVGRFLQTLQREGLYQDSCIVFLSDHGIPLGEHGSMMKTFENLYGELLEIPVAIKPPAELNDQCVDDTEGVVRTDDIPVTILNILGLSSETGVMSGRDLRPQLVGRQEAVRTGVTTGYHNSQHRVHRTNDWSYVLRPGNQPDELYDLNDDPLEQQNLAASKPNVSKQIRETIGHVVRKSGNVQTA